MLELMLIERIIEGNDKPLSVRDIDDVREGNWEKFISKEDEMTVRYL